MLAGKNKELQHIVNLRNHGKFSEASEKLAEFEKKNQKPESRIRAQLIKALLTAQLGFWEKSLEILETAISESELLGDQLVIIDTYIVKANCLLFAQQYKKTILQVEETEKILAENLKPDEDDFEIRKAKLLHIKGNSLSWLCDYKHAQETAQQGFVIVQSLNDSELLFNYYQLLGICEFQADAFDEAVVHYKAGYQLAKDSKNNWWRILFSMKIGESYRGNGNFTLAMEYIDIAIEYSNKLGIPANWLIYFKAILYWNMNDPEKTVSIFKEVIPSLEHEKTHKEKGLVLMGKAIIELVEGELDKTIEYMTEAVGLAKKMEDPFSTNIFSIILIRAFNDKGEFDKALELCFSLLETFKDGKKPISIYSVFFEMGKAYHIKGEYNLALEYVQKALKLYREFGRDLFISQSLFTLVQISIDKNDKELYTKYLEELEEFVKLHPTELFDQMFQTTQALVLKNSTRPRDWMKAADILIKVVKEKFTQHGFVVIALINLCELLMNEFSISGDSQVLQELEFYMDELSELAQMQNVYHLRIEANNLQILTHWLKAQKSMVEIDLQKAKILLDNTRKITDEEGMLRLAEKLTQQQEKLLGQLFQWDDFIRKYYEFIKE